MTDLTIATWNINSVRLRVDTVLAYLREHTPDVLALQEIKATDEQFPAEAFVEAGWPHIAVNGFMGYNGVAIVSRVPFADTGQKDWCGKTDGRHVWAVLPGGIELNNFYVPAGGDVPDPDLNPKFAHKLQFVDDMTCWFAARKAPKNRLVLVGDLNIAPLEADVWSHKQLLKVVSHTPVEVAAMERLRKAHDWVDAVRYFVAPDDKLYSWWSYRAKDWEAADKGRRLDHVWVTPPLRRFLTSAEVHKHVRGWELPSDHAPVAVTMEDAVLSDMLNLAVDGPVATITLNRPAKHNLLEIADMGAFSTLLDDIDARDGVRVVVLTGTGERTFCAGVDLGAVHETDWSDNPLEPLCDRLEAMTMPMVCALNGSVYGGACDVALACDFRIGVDGMKLVMPPARLGVIFHETGLRRFVERLGPQIARRLFLASETMAADELYRIGFLDRVVARGDFPRVVETLADELAGMAPMAVRGMKRAINEISRGTLDSARLKNEILACFASEDLIEGLAASRQKRKPEFKGK